MGNYGVWSINKLSLGFECEDSEAYWSLVVQGGPSGLRFVVMTRDV